jgi:hypothetical protein
LANARVRPSSGGKNRRKQRNRGCSLLCCLCCPGGHKELGRFKAIEGKTWNHPVVARGKLFVRNDEEAACYQLMEEPGVDTVNR